MKSFSIGFILLAVFAGMMLPSQAAVNSTLGQHLKNPLLAAWISFAGAMILITLMVIFSTSQFPKMAEFQRIPWYFFTGGALGMTGVIIYIITTPKLGVTVVTASALTGQMIIALLIDYFGLFGLPVVKISWTRVLGIASLILGVYLVKKT